MSNQTKTLRDEFAMAALTGFLANPRVGGDYPGIAKETFTAADAMLAAREAKAAPEPAPAADPVQPANVARWYTELLGLLGATCQTDAVHLINGLVAVKIDEAEARATLALYRALGVRDQEAALAKIKELTK